MKSRAARRSSLADPVRAGALALAVALAACAAPAIEGGDPRIERAAYTSDDGTYRLELPLGWRRSGQALTRDGWEAQTISFNAGKMARDANHPPIDTDAPGFFAAMQKELTAQTGVEVLECGPAELDGLAGFRMHFLRGSTGANDAPAKREYLTYGALGADELFVFTFEAPAGTGFAQDLPVFETLVRSFRRSNPAAGAGPK